MIVSASYRTDIPAFYGDWFMRRLDAGECLVANPYGGRPYRVSLDRGAVEGFVFWTRNPDPFADNLAEIKERGYAFVIQFTIVGYPSAIDRSVPPADAQLDLFVRLAEVYGHDALVWRYDPIVLSSLTPPDFHQENFRQIAVRLAGFADEVVISFMNPYRKSRRNLDAAAKRHDFSWWAASHQEAAELTAQFAAVAAEYNMRLSICSQPQYLVPPAMAARCVDAERLSRVAGRQIAARQKGNRTGCMCHESRDIGAYDTCPHGCVYCYAVNDRLRAVARLKLHDPDAKLLGSESLIERSLIG